MNQIYIFCQQYSLCLCTPAANLPPFWSTRSVRTIFTFSCQNVLLQILFVTWTRRSRLGLLPLRAMGYLTQSFSSFISHSGKLFLPSFHEMCGLTCHRNDYFLSHIAGFQFMDFYLDISTLRVGMVEIWVSRSFIPFPLVFYLLPFTLLCYALSSSHLLHLLNTATAYQKSYVSYLEHDRYQCWHYPCSQPQSSRMYERDDHIMHFPAEASWGPSAWRTLRWNTCQPPRNVFLSLYVPLLSFYLRTCRT